MSVPTTSLHETTDGPPRGSHWPQVLASAQDPETQPMDLLRQIIVEMSRVCDELRKTAEHPSLAFKIKPLMAQLQGLRRLAETVCSVDELRVRTDALDLDGPKFSYVMGAFFEILKQSAREAGCSEFLLHSVLMFFGDNLGQAEPEIRKNVKNAHKTTGTEGFMWPQAGAQPSPENSEQILKEGQVLNSPRANC